MKLPFSISDFRAVGIVLLLLGSLLSGLTQPKSGLQLPPPLNVAEAEAKGRALVNDLLAQKPTQNTTNTGVLIIRDAEGRERTVPVRFEIFSTPTNWVSVYEATGPSAENGVRLTVLHNDGAPNEYWLSRTGGTNNAPTRLTGNETMRPFAGSDFWVTDLGLEFLHWPKQLVTKQELRRSQSCNVLESYNPQPAPGAYSRVVSWIGIESGGIIMANAYDVRGELLKQFLPKVVRFEGQWQLKEMEIENRQTNSRTRIQFNLQ